MRPMPVGSMAYSAGSTMVTRIWLASLQSEEGLGLLGHVPEVDEVHGFANDIEDVAMLAGGGVGLMFNCT
ncbi:hypothetical protein [Xanthobacter sediminis]|uniref:hypothetical protein n=1 Tax=Xanthobacter sediminis TaxID=3119926 RepID=UPI00372829B6